MAVKTWQTKPRMTSTNDRLCVCIAPICLVFRLKRECLFVYWFSACCHMNASSPLPPNPTYRAPPSPCRARVWGGGFRGTNREWWNGVGAEIRGHYLSRSFPLSASGGWDALSSLPARRLTLAACSELMTVTHKHDAGTLLALLHVCTGSRGTNMFTVTLGASTRQDT